MGNYWPNTNEKYDPYTSFLQLDNNTNVHIRNYN